MHLLSDSIADDERGAYGELAIASLDMLALYDRVLDVIWWFARDTLAHEPDLAADSLSLDHFIRAPDGDQARLFVRLADGLGVPGDRSNFVSVFNRLKEARHHIAHAPEMHARTEDGVPGIGIPYYHQNQARVDSLDGGRSRITPGLVRKRIREAHWLLQHVEWCRVHMGQFGGPLSMGDLAPSEAPPRVVPT